MELKGGGGEDIHGGEKHPSIPWPCMPGYMLLPPCLGVTCSTDYMCWCENVGHLLSKAKLSLRMALLSPLLKLAVLRQR